MSTQYPHDTGLEEFYFHLDEIDRTLVCFLEFSPGDVGSTDEYGLKNEPDYPDTWTLVQAFVKGTDVDIAPLLTQEMVDAIQISAQEYHDTPVVDYE